MGTQGEGKAWMHSAGTLQIQPEQQQEEVPKQPMENMQLPPQEAEVPEQPHEEVRMESVGNMQTQPQQTEAVMPEQQTEAVMPEQQTEALMPEQQTEAVMPEQQTEAVRMQPMENVQTQPQEVQDSE